MRTHDQAERPSLGHPLLKSLPEHLKKTGLPSISVEFLERRLFFAYPRTLWLKIGIDPEASGEVGIRHSLDFSRLGKTLNSWLKRNPAIRTLVFDLRGVRIFDAQGLLSLYDSAVLPKTKFILCENEIDEILRAKTSVPPEKLFSSESILLSHLRDVPPQRLCQVLLPKSLELHTLDQALKEQASDLKLRRADAISLDMSNVTTMSFRAHSMISPVIHSLAHSHGILATIQNPRPRIINDMVNHGTLRPMRSYIIQTPHEWRSLPNETTLPKGVTPMRLFGEEELERLQKFGNTQLRAFLTHYVEWFASVSDLSHKPANFKIMENSFVSLLKIVHELTQNVTAHSQGGLGYFLAELDPLPKGGLSLYIGDTGVGLAAGIESRYNIKVKSDLAAVKLAFSLIDKFDKRKRDEILDAPVGGRGLEDVRQMLRELSGTLSIRSGRAMATYDPRKRKMYTELFPDLYNVQGTHIHINIPSHWKVLP